MLRLLSFLVALALVAFGLMWLADNPGEVALTWRGTEYDVSLMFALGIVIALALALGVVWSILRFVFRIPSLLSLAQRARRREKGYAALSRGMIAVGSGDARSANRHAAEARKFLADEPLAKLLRAQAAQLLLVPVRWPLVGNLFVIEHHLRFHRHRFVAVRDPMGGNVCPVSLRKACAGIRHGHQRPAAVHLSA